MSLFDAISQYTKLAEQLSSNSANGSSNGLLDMAKQLLGGEKGNLIQSFLSNLSPEIIQKLSALKALASGEGGSVNSQEGFMDTFKQLASKFASQDTNQQVAQLSEPQNINLISKAAELAKSFGINLDNLV